MITCSVGGGDKFTETVVLWDSLASQWQLAPNEGAYVDRQQGTSCANCGSNLRSIALADAIRSAVGTDLTLQAYVTQPEASTLTVLEINEAGHLSPTLRQLPGHVLAAYPAVDIHALPYPSNTFDIVVHSDTLEHVTNAVHALMECHRVLRACGWLCFTVPTIIGRLSRSRSGLAKSFHGTPHTATDDFVVHTEFGSDMWTYVLHAGFSSVTVNTVDFPAALALSARKSGPQCRSDAASWLWPQ